ncbi:13577_t:CDS:2 [Entrophospora sp. SA101]|nr:13577_t:CDS:2 [Entrophospora sp. SA101]
MFQTEKQSLNLRYSWNNKFLKILFIIFVLWIFYSSYAGNLKFSSLSSSSSHLSTPSQEDILPNNQNTSPTLTQPHSTPPPILSPEDISINLKYCGEPECKFMFVYTVFGEQVTRLNLHFSSLAKLSIFLNRTLVLTNVGHSEMNACSDFPFEFYYDIEQLKKNMPGLQVITQKDFYNWIRERSFKPNVTLSYMSHKEPRFTSSKPSTQFFKNPEDEQCYNSLNLKPIDYKEVYCGANIRTKEYREEMKSFLMKEFDTDVEILLIRYILYGGEFLEKGSVLAYAKHIVEASSRVVNKLKPFIAIHWRMESADEELAPKCSLQLNHHLAISYLNSLLSVKTWVSMKALDYLSDDKRLDQKAVQHELKGAGVQGIMDKLILMNADYFVSGPSGCARIRSLYTYKIKEGRKKIIREQKNTNLKNIVYIWNSTKV